MKPTELLAAAAAARKHAHAPYSNYQVGAALLTEDEGVITGCNVENASYGLTICAERVAIGAAIAAGKRRFKAIAIVADGGPPPFPCGACRQVLAEFCRPDTPVYIAGSGYTGDYESTTLGALLPHAFRMD
ncbi:MAG: cytidine deaminase [Kiritimatiellia bacterium]|jgi:cytidine deaminase|nr:cytidine deaminase [Kiritimatiellia bacterium]MDP6629871.1 cytidine deaminase [Kiritimatiellia bacterium]MDP6809706.1 cytidine deaminase [Kiritimatiellia bacterium]MDP7025184.1 cytidine deaminase [Kiritimatiellia bacterium]